MSETNAVAVQQTLDAFLEAFDSLDWERFRHFFAADATVFFPFDTALKRADGREEVAERFKAFFDEVHAQRSGPPYLHLTPQDVEVRLLHDVALVSFHLRRPQSVGRRTLLLQEQPDGWKIVHLHASNMMIEGRV